MHPKNSSKQSLQGTKVDTTINRRANQNKQQKSQQKPPRTLPDNKSWEPKGKIPGWKFQQSSQQIHADYPCQFLSVLFYLVMFYAVQYRFIPAYNKNSQPFPRETTGCTQSKVSFNKKCRRKIHELKQSTKILRILRNTAKTRVKPLFFNRTITV